MAYQHKWSPISYRSSAGQRKDIGQRPMLYRWTTQPTTEEVADDVLCVVSALNPCDYNNAGCEQQCVRVTNALPGQLGYRCDCQYGVLAPDNHTCVSSSEYFFFYLLPSRILDPLRFQAGGRRRRPNLGLVFIWLMLAVFLVKDE